MATGDHWLMLTRSEGGAADPPRLLVPESGLSTAELATVFPGFRFLRRSADGFALAKVARVDFPRAGGAELQCVVYAAAPPAGAPAPATGDMTAFLTAITAAATAATTAAISTPAPRGAPSCCCGAAWSPEPPAVAAPPTPPSPSPAPPPQPSCGDRACGVCDCE
jgi:hypothetical protein